jgi:hypothetical protein
MTLDLTDDEALALAQFLRHTIDDDRYPPSPRRAPLKAILEKLDPPKPLPATPSPLKGRMKSRNVGQTCVSASKFVNAATPQTVAFCPT